MINYQVIIIFTYLKFWEIDFFDPQEFLKLTKKSELIPEMILNRRVAGEDLIKGLDLIGSSVNESGDDLWQFVISPLLAELSEKKWDVAIGADLGQSFLMEGPEQP